MRYASQLEEAGMGKSLPPVERWDPPYCGDIDLEIAYDGLWMFEGTPIGRARLVRLFSTVLRREGEQYFLVTPVEKIGIRVAFTPFIAVLCDRREENGNKVLQFTTNVHDQVEAGKDNAIFMRNDPTNSEPVPVLHVRANLFARIARPVYFDLVEWGETHPVNETEMFGVWSHGQFFPFDEASKVFGGIE